MGRFISEDPARDPNNPNLYTYARNNPLRFFDPTGLISLADIGLSSVTTGLSSKELNEIQIDKPNSSAPKPPKPASAPAINPADFQQAEQDLSTIYSGMPPDPTPELPKDGPSTPEKVGFGEAASITLGNHFTIGVGAFEGVPPEFFIDEEGNINISIIITNVARLSFDVHDTSQSSGLRIDIECGKGIVEVVGGKSGIVIRAEADAVRVTATGYHTIYNKKHNLAVHAEIGVGGGIRLGRGGFGLTKFKPGKGGGFDYKIESIK